MRLSGACPTVTLRCSRASSARRTLCCRCWAAADSASLPLPCRHSGAPPTAACHCCACNHTRHTQPLLLLLLLLLHLQPSGQHHSASTRGRLTRLQGRYKRPVLASELCVGQVRGAWLPCRGQRACGPVRRHLQLCSADLTAALSCPGGCRSLPSPRSRRWRWSPTCCSPLLPSASPTQCGCVYMRHPCSVCRCTRRREGAGGQQQLAQLLLLPPLHGCRCVAAPSQAAATCSTWPWPPARWVVACAGGGLVVPGGGVAACSHAPRADDLAACPTPSLVRPDPPHLLPCS